MFLGAFTLYRPENSATRFLSFLPLSLSLTLSLSVSICLSPSLCISLSDYHPEIPQYTCKQSHLTIWYTLRVLCNYVLYTIMTNELINNKCWSRFARFYTWNGPSPSCYPATAWRSTTAICVCSTRPGGIALHWNSTGPPRCRRLRMRRPILCGRTNKWSAENRRLLLLLLYTPRLLLLYRHEIITIQLVYDTSTVVVLYIIIPTLTIIFAYNDFD